MLLRTLGGGVVFTVIAENEGRPVGFLTFDITRHYTRFLVAHMFVFYVEKEARGHFVGRGLIQAAESGAKAAGAKYFYGSSSAGFSDDGRNDKALLAIYERLGFEGNGFFMRKTLNE
jgi:GNAT superfamily N-acetyltransferase